MQDSIQFESSLSVAERVLALVLGFLYEHRVLAPCTRGYQYLLNLGYRCSDNKENKLGLSCAKLRANLAWFGFV